MIPLFRSADFVVNFSGGKDSSAMLDYLCEQFPWAKKSVVFADTGWEHDDTEQWCRELVARMGLMLYTVRNPNKDFFSMVRARGMFPSPQYRQCTSDLKRSPIEKWIRNNCGSLVVNCLGLRAEESEQRAKKKPWSINTSLTNSRRTVFDWLPIHHWSEQEVIYYLVDRDIPLHPVYQYLNRFSCQVCIYASKADLRAIKHHNPMGFQKIVDLEKEIGFTMKSTGSLEEEVQRD